MNDSLCHLKNLEYAHKVTLRIITDLYPSIQEMESDVEDRATTFNKFAHKEYVRYVGKIEKVLEELGSIATETN